MPRDVTPLTNALGKTTPGDQSDLAEKVTDDDDEENPVKYLATNKIDAPSAHVIRTYSYRWRIETFFEDSKQDLGLGETRLESLVSPFTAGTRSQRSYLQPLFLGPRPT